MEKIRKEINNKDEEILHSFQERLRLVLKILKLKKERGNLIEDSKREEEVLSNVLKHSSSCFYDYNKLLFLNIINISKIFQYEKMNKRIEKNMIMQNYYNRKIKVFSFNVDDELFNLKKFSKFEVENIFKLDLAFFKLKTTKRESLLVLKINKSEINVFKTIFKFNVIVNEIINFKNSSYWVLSKNLYFKKGENFLILKLKFKEFNKTSLILNYVKNIDKIKILKFNLNEIENNCFKLHLSFKANFKDESSLLKILNFFINFTKSLKILGFFKING